MCCSLILVVFLGGIFINAIALDDEYRNSIQDVSRRINMLENELEEESSKIELINELTEEIEKGIENCYIAVEKYDHETMEIQEKINIDEDALEKLEYETHKIDIQLNVKERNLTRNKERYSNQIRFLYVNGMAEHMNNIAQIDSWEGLLSYINFVRKLNKDNKTLFERIIKDMEVIKENRNILDRKKRMMIELKEDNIAHKASIEEKRKEQLEIIEEIKIKKSKYQNILKEHNVNKSKIEEMIDEAERYLEDIKIKKKLANDNTTRREKLLYIAYEFIGDPYLWGGTRPYDGKPGSGFDCSGFVQYCYGKIGVEIGRNTYAQISENKGYEVGRAELMPGDLVFFGSKKYPHHVGIYVGNNSYIHSPRTGEYIKISPMVRNDFVCGKRIIE